MSEGENSSYERLHTQSSLKDILRVAIEFETTARDFYTDLIPRVSKNLRYLVEELAQEEQEHVELFTRLAEDPAMQTQIEAEVATPASDHKFSDCIHLPDLGDNPDDQAVLQYALMREHTAMLQYTALAENTEPGPIQALFQYLANEETKHKNELEKKYYEIIHSGGV